MKMNTSKAARKPDLEMKIENTTDDESRTGRSVSRLALATSSKLKSYISKRFSHKSSDQGYRLSPRSGSPVTSRPVLRNTGLSTSPYLPVEDSTTWLIEQHREEKAKRKEEKTRQENNDRGKYLVPERKGGIVAGKGTVTPVPSPKGGKVKTKSGTRSEETRNPERQCHMESLHIMRTAMREGKLEKVVPPDRERRARNPFLDPRSRSSSESRSRHTSPSGPSSRSRNSSRSRYGKTTSKMAEYIGASADMLDETRREIRCRLRPPFEHLTFPPLVLSRKPSVASSASTESFYCRGGGPHASLLEGGGNEVGNDRDIDPQFQLAPLAVGEREIFSPRARVPGISRLVADGSICQVDTERRYNFKPTPPLKDHKTLEMRKSRPTLPSSASPTQILAPPPGNNYERLASFNSASKPVIQPRPSRQFSQSADVEEVINEEYDARIRKLEAALARDRDANNYQQLEAWPSCSGSGDYIFMEDEEVPLAESGGRRGSSNEFWDDVPGGYSPRI